MTTTNGVEGPNQSTLVDSFKKAIVGDPDNAVIQAGTLAVTRATNAIAIAIAASYAAMQVSGFEAWEVIPPAERIWLAIAVAALWAVGSAADAIARGIASSKPDAQPSLVQLPSGLMVKKTEGDDDPGWLAVAVRPDVGDLSARQWLIVKGTRAEWTDKIVFED